MKVRTSVTKGIAFVAISALTFAACEDKATAPEPLPDIVVSVTPETIGPLQISQTAAAIATVSNVPAGGNTGITWRSSNTAVATVEPASGPQVTITGRGAGTALITAISAQDTTKRDAVLVTVVGAPTPTITLTVAPAQVTLQAPGTNPTVPGDSITLTAVVNGSSNQAVRYRSSAPAVATVDSITGRVRALTPGVTLITGRALADTINARATSEVTVVPRGVTPISITLTPFPTAATSVTDSIIFVASVTGTSNTAVTWRTSNASVASVTPLATNPLLAVVRGLSQGTAVITVFANADSLNARISTTLTVGPPPTQPSISLGAVLGTPVATGIQAPIPSGATIAGNLIVPVNVTAGSQTNIQRVAVMLGNREACTQVYNPPLAPTQGVAQITCTINTAQVDSLGQPLFPNGTYQLRAVAFAAGDAANPAGVQVAEAIFGSVILANANQVTGVVTFDNSLDDVDNNPDASTEVTGGGITWFGGSVTVELTAAIFQGPAVATAMVTVDLNCSGTQEAGEPTAAITFTNGRGSVTFSEAVLMANNGVDDVEDPSVCFTAHTARDNAGAIVALPAGAGRGQILTLGTALVTQAGAAPGVTQNVFPVDNVQPVFPAVVVVDPVDFDNLLNNVYLGIGGSFTLGPGAPGALGAPTLQAQGGGSAFPTDAGVGGVTVRLFAVPLAAYNTATATDTTQASLQAAAAAGTLFTTADQLTSTLESTAYVLVIEATDALGNVVYTGHPTHLAFGVDLARPVISVVTTGGVSAPANAINPTVLNVRVQVTDEFSGAEGVTGTVIGYSVFEYDADNAVEEQCFDMAGNLLGTATAAAPCVVQQNSSPVLTQGATEFYDITIPSAENHYVITVNAVDAAGNTSSTTITREALVDVTAGPDAATGLDPVTISTYTIDNTNNTATISGTVRDNIEVAKYDPRFNFTGGPTLVSGAGRNLAAGTTIDLPDAVPFTPPTNVGTYGLPLTAEATASNVQTPVAVDNIISASAAGFPVATLTQFGFGVEDLAGNFAFSGIPVPAGSFDGVQNLTSDSLAQPGPFPGGSLDRTPGGGGTPRDTASFTAVVTTPVGAPSPVTHVFFYYVHPGADLVYGGTDDHLVLITSVPAANCGLTGGSAFCQVLTGESVREYRFRMLFNVNVLPPNPVTFAYRFVAIGVSADGDAFITEVDAINVAN